MTDSSSWTEGLLHEIKMQGTQRRNDTPKNTLLIVVADQRKDYRLWLTDDNNYQNAWFQMYSNINIQSLRSLLVMT